MYKNFNLCIKSYNLYLSPLSVVTTVSLPIIFTTHFESLSNNSLGKKLILKLILSNVKI